MGQLVTDNYDILEFGSNDIDRRKRSHNDHVKMVRNSTCFLWTRRRTTVAKTNPREQVKG